MHELSIAVNLVDAVARQAEREGSTRVRTVFVRIGALSGVVREALEFSFDVATEGTLVQDAVLDVEEVPVVVFCPQCREEQQLADPFVLRCPVCSTPTSDVRQGRELEITAIEVED